MWDLFAQANPAAATKPQLGAKGGAIPPAPPFPTPPHPTVGAKGGAPKINYPTPAQPLAPGDIYNYSYHADRARDTDWSLPYMYPTRLFECSKMASTILRHAPGQGTPTPTAGAT